ncbi:hypothetical protein [Kangiella koreensis]|uniref:Uncharacterized protein n=1 Tax=Kangiella koreensis (strain DSM 16069 / JCM 12317 / KCTC 12182 / SW-125) TaxID=523791 RepID=C7RC01_KANKD|nr:hypothetical protein [Kangiella koreensis]ACV26793.1 hypothetical protein Kkor_1380 [Kangiella koreensis DSM 16069]
MNKSAIKELSSDALEVALDSNLGSGILRDIPIFGSAVKVAELTMSIRDRFFLKKLGCFIYQLDELSKKDKDAVLSFSKTDDSEKVANKIIQVIDNVTDVEKTELIGKLFAAYCKRSIDKPSFLRAVDTVQHYFLDDINNFISIDNIHLFTFYDLESRKVDMLVGSQLIKEQYIKQNELIRMGYDSSELDITYFEDSQFGRIFREALKY